jgi:hypothetical protein
MKKFKINIGFPSTLVLFLLLLFILFFASFVFSRKITDLRKSLLKPVSTEKNIGIVASPTTSVKPDLKNKVIVTGIIRSTGLTPEEKEKLDLNFSNFQIVVSGNLEKDKIRGYFLEVNDLFSAGYQGKCVKIEGTLVSGWGDIGSDYQKNGQFTYGNLAVLPEYILPMKMTDCSAYKETTGAEKYFDLISFSGILKHGIRPAPDIGYDYILELDEEYLDSSSSAGYPVYLKQIDVIPLNDGVWIEIEENIDKQVTLEGYYLWGYAESKYLEVHSIK